MELKDTVKGMMSDDYKERMAAEYHQTKIRYEKLKKLNTRIRQSTNERISSTSCHEILSPGFLAVSIFCSTVDITSSVKIG